MSIDPLAVTWLILAVVLGGAELLVPGVFLIFIAIAAAITGLASIALPGLPLVGQLLSFAIWTAVTILIGRRWYHDYPVATTDPMLNDRAARLIGEIVTVAQTIEQGRGRVRLGDGEWMALGPDLPVGARARVVGVEETAVRVEALPPLPPPPLPAA
jgi:membrane protein implicated in regulation of membrane protease activity